MAPIASLRRFNAITSTPDTGEQGSPQIAIIVPVVLGSVIVVAVSVFLAIRFSRSRRNSQPKIHNSSLSRKWPFRQPARDLDDKREQQEMQRSIIIRKSLASRASTQLSQVLSEDVPTDEEEVPIDEEQRHSGGLKDDWKEWEAGIQRERSLNVQRHPAHERTKDPAKAICIQLTSLSRGATVVTRARENQPLPPVPDSGSEQEDALQRRSEDLDPTPPPAPPKT